MDGIVKWILAATLVAHGSVHSLGFLWAFDLAELQELGGPSLMLGGAERGDATLIAFGMLWLVSMLAFFGAGLAVAAGSDWWPRLAGIAAGISLVPTIAWWNDAWRGALISLAILAWVAISDRRSPREGTESSATPIAR